LCEAFRLEGPAPGLRSSPFDIVPPRRLLREKAYKKSIELIELDGFLRKRVNEEERVFSIVDYYYT